MSDHSPPGSSVHGDSLGKNTAVGCHALLQGNLPDPRIKPVSLMSPVLAGGFFTTSATVQNKWNKCVPSCVCSLWGIWKQISCAPLISLVQDGQFHFLQSIFVVTQLLGLLMFIIIIVVKDTSLNVALISASSGPMGVLCHQIILSPVWPCTELSRM